MALGSKNRDYKTSDRLVQATMNVHAARMGWLVGNSTLSLEEASAKAYREIRLGEHRTEIQNEVKRLAGVRK